MIVPTISIDIARHGQAGYTVSATLQNWNGTQVLYRTLPMADSIAAQVDADMVSRQLTRMWPDHCIIMNEEIYA